MSFAAIANKPFRPIFSLAIVKSVVGSAANPTTKAFGAAFAHPAMMSGLGVNSSESDPLLLRSLPEMGFATR